MEGRSLLDWSLKNAHFSLLLVCAACAIFTGWSPWASPEQHRLGFTFNSILAVCVAVLAGYAMYKSGVALRWDGKLMRREVLRGFFLKNESALELIRHAESLRDKLEEERLAENLRLADEELARAEAEAAEARRQARFVSRLIKDLEPFGWDVQGTGCGILTYRGEAAARAFVDCCAYTLEACERIVRAMPDRPDVLREALDALAERNGPRFLAVEARALRYRELRDAATKAQVLDDVLPFLAAWDFAGAEAAHKEAGERRERRAQAEAWRDRLIALPPTKYPLDGDELMAAIDAAVPLGDRPFRIAVHALERALEGKRNAARA